MAIDIGMVWYAREDYPRVLEIMEDAEDLQSTWDEWLKDAERVEQRLRREGHKVVRLRLLPDAFVGWCRSEGRTPNGSARSHWASVRPGVGDKDGEAAGGTGRS